MKTSKATIVIITIVILIISGLSFAGGFSRPTAATAPDISGQTAGGVVETNDVYPPQIRTTRTDPTNLTGIAPERPAKRVGESDAAYQNRLRSWETEVRRIAAAGQNRPTTVTARTGITEHPVRRDGESDVAYQTRLRNWEAAMLRQEEDLKLQKVMQNLLATTRSTSWSPNTFSGGSGNVLIIPMEEMKTEDFLSINEDMNVMSQILINELNQKGIILPNYGSLSLGGYGAGATSGYGTNLGYAANPLSNMYLQGYGALFLINVGFPLAAVPETKEQSEETKKGNVDEVWELARQQMYQAGPATVNTRQSYDNQDVGYDAQRVENLKKTLIESLKHAVNIRTLRADEAVIVRITGSGQSVKVIAVTKQENQTLVTYESNGVRHNAVISTNLDDFTRTLSSPTVLVIRVKKSDIDAFAKGELDFAKFREKVQVFSYPLISGNSGEARYYGI